MRTFSFNRPVTLLFSLPLVVLMAMFVSGLTVEFRVMELVMLMVTAGLVGLLVYLGLFRRLRVGEGKAMWITPRRHYEFPLSELKHYGIIKFRMFRFAYLSRAEQAPFRDPGSAMVSDADTFLIQYRPGAWNYLQKVIHPLHPHLKPESFSRQ